MFKTLWWEYQTESLLTQFVSKVCSREHNAIEIVTLLSLLIGASSDRPVAIMSSYQLIGCMSASLLQNIHATIRHKAHQRLQIPLVNPVHSRKDRRT